MAELIPKEDLNKYISNEKHQLEIEKIHKEMYEQIDKKEKECELKLIRKQEINDQLKD